MEKEDFRSWLKDQGMSDKVAGDHISRVKRMERELSNCLYKDITIDQQYEEDGCKYVLSLFYKSGVNDEMKKLEGINLPIGKYHIVSIKGSIKKYIEFLQNREN